MSAPDLEPIMSQLDGANFPVSVAQLATSVGADPARFDFRRRLWQAMERFRETTGIQLRTEDGHVVLLSPSDQVEAARARFRTSATRGRRGFEIASGAMRRGDDEAAQSAARLIHSQTAGGAARDAGALRERQEAERGATVRDALARSIRDTARPGRK